VIKKMLLHVPKYLAFLEAAGFDSLEARLKPLGVHIHDPKFWQKGFDEIRGLVKRFGGSVAEKRG
jgi:oligoendopeptidase F